MLLLLNLIVLTSIWCLGIKIVTSEGMILHSLELYGSMKVKEGKRVFEPLIVCEWCLPSIHSLFGYSFAIALGVVSSLSWALIFIYPLVVMGSSLVTGVTWNAYKTMMAAKEMYESKMDYYDSQFEETEYHENDHAMFNNN